MKVIVLIITVLSVSVSLFAQDNKEENKYNETIMYSNITEFGIAAASPRGIALEGTTVHGFSLHKQHHLGVGIGIGFTSCSYTYRYYYPYGGYSSMHSYSSGYTPIFVNYRYYFFPNRKRSPHVNASLGGLITGDGESSGGGIYSSITMGYRVRKFSLSSGFTFMAICNEEEQVSYGYAPTKNKWHFPVGFTIKLGFSF